MIYEEGRSMSFYNFSLNYEVCGNHFVFEYASQIMETAYNSMGTAMSDGYNFSFFTNSITDSVIHSYPIEVCTIMRLTLLIESQVSLDSLSLSFSEYFIFSHSYRGS
jgi:hypothetical protein